MVIEATAVYILILVSVTLTFFKVIGIRQSKNVCASYPSKFSIDLDGIWYAFETSWSDKFSLF